MGLKFYLKWIVVQAHQKFTIEEGKFTKAFHNIKTLYEPSKSDL